MGGMNGFARQGAALIFSLAITSVTASCAPRAFVVDDSPVTVHPGPALAAPRSLETNRLWDVLPKPDTSTASPSPAPIASSPGQRRSLAIAGGRLAEGSIHFSGVEIDGHLLAALARRAPDEPFLRVVREGLGRAVDLEDFLFFLDDLLLAASRGARGQTVWITPGRARGAGILIHPDEVFGEKRPRLYGTRGPLSIDRPTPQRDLPAAADGDALGPNWAMRFRNPDSEGDMLAALAARAPSPDFEARVRSLMEQLREQGAKVSLNSTLRSRERGYLMWGADLLRRSESEAAVDDALARLERARVDWQLDVDIAWRLPAGWRATREAAREMAETYQVVFASERGARSSKHYTGEAVDLSAVALPRRLVLRGADGSEMTFDLSGPDESRDLSVSPALVAWVEAHFGLSKLRSDYPHWNDARSVPGSR